MAVLAENKEDVAKFKDFAVGAAPAKPAAAKAAPAEKATATVNAQAPAAAAAPVAPPSSTSSDRILASPVARKIAMEKGIDLTQVKGTGPRDRITKWDVASFKPSATVAAQQTTAAPKPSASSAAPLSSGSFVDTPLTNMRKVRLNSHLFSKGDCSAFNGIKTRHSSLLLDH